GGAYQTMATPSPAMMEAAKDGAPGGAGKDGEAPRVRRFFTDTAYWGPSVITGPDGSAEVKFLIPDNLTTWRATARGLTKVTQAGEVRKDVVVTMPLLVRLTLPRFYVQGDEGIAAATVHNYTGTERTVKVSMTTQGAELLEPAEKTIKLANDGIQRLTWKIKVTRDNSVRFLVSADGGPGGKDAMESTLPVQPDGVKDVVAAAGMTATKDTATLNLPASAVPGSGSVQVSLSPSLAGPLFEALEYLTTYPYGCAEQTMDGFLPDLIVANTLKQLGAQRPRPKMLDRYVSFGLQKLLRFQHSDGGWHWWEHDDSDPFITAYVVYGLKLASDAGYVGAGEAMVKGTVYLRNALKEAQYRDAQAYLLWAAAYAGVWDAESLTLAQKIGGDLFEQRAKLDYFSRASLALACNALANSVKAEDVDGLRLKATTIAAELDKEAKPQGVGAYWAADGRYQYSWLDNNVEVTSQVLSMLLTLKPDSTNIVPAVRWLMAARDGKQWSSTKDTAAAVLALTQYLQQSKELQPSFTARVFSGDKLIQELKFAPKDAFADPVKVNISALDLKPGDNALRIEKDGTGNVYWAARLSYLTPSAQVVPVAKGIEVERKYRVPAVDPSAAGTLDPGSVVYVDVTIRNSENLRYALLQEPIPAGCEVVEGEDDYQPEIALDRREVWDNKLVLYFDYLHAGERTFSYILRTEAPGNYRILPTSAELMYFPEVRGNGKPVRVKIADVAGE
ncbi:MAG: alpha-2-macroglobulin family protein, partial [Armatimonadota bacterium]